MSLQLFRRALRSLGPRPRPRRTLSRTVLAAGLLLGALSAAATGGAAADDAAPTDPAAPAFWVDPDSAAARQVAQWQREGRTADAHLIQRIAGQPQAVWLFGDGSGPVVRTHVEAAAKAGRTPVFVAYFIPHRDCGAYSSGGARDAADYRRWIEELASEFGTGEAYVIVEPDAVAQLVAGCPSADATERYALLAHAVQRLKRNPHTKVYLDAGNAGWIPDERRLVDPLRRAGIAEADGFALNVSNHHTDEVSSAYGHRLAKALGGDKHFVVDSSRNGNGPYAGDQPWCNPPGRALGRPPTSKTGDPTLDAYLWIKRPGESDGTCRGGPKAGQWWPEYALDLARRTRVQEAQGSQQEAQGSQVAWGRPPSGPDGPGTTAVAVISTSRPG
ncbi:glycoside hydrolase family 6 protein [Streptomyces sp. NPDC058308]|uniref:glycoside hydrolase family 6 protein n=1 Tax=Streptomyces sp. NPDC058308 TaxID=3346440 RepID=UPI0036F0D70B